MEVAFPVKLSLSSHCSGLSTCCFADSVSSKDWVPAGQKQVDPAVAFDTVKPFAATHLGQEEQVVQVCIVLQ